MHRYNFLNAHDGYMARLLEQGSAKALIFFGAPQFTAARHLQARNKLAM